MPSSSRLSARAVALLTAVVVLVSSGCSTGDTTSDSAAAPERPGELLSPPVPSQGYPALDSLAAESLKIRYRSTSGIDGSPTSVSGVVFVPKGNPPPGGWVVASVAHATAGVTTDCAPSNFPNLLGSLPEAVVSLSEDYVVVISDYQGLGSPGVHPYLEPKTAAYNVIDAVRAAREAVPNTSDRWIAFGQSQGGQAVWAANEQAAEYGSGLNLTGVVAASPATDLRPMAEAVINGTLTPDQVVLLPLLLEGLRAVDPEFDPMDYLHGDLAERHDVFLACADTNQELKAILARAAKPADYRPATPEAADRLRRLLAAHSLPSQPTTAPMLVAYGQNDPILKSEWTAAAVTQACRQGDKIEAHELAGQGHTVSVSSDATTWLTARIAGQPMVSTCDPAVAPAQPE